MFILYRYIFKALIGPFLFGLFVIIFLFLTNTIIKEISFFLSKDVPLIIIGEFVVLSLAWIVALAVPMAVLLAVLMAFGKFSADNEITAMKANGIGMHQIMAPVLLAAGIVTVCMFFFNDYVLPEVNHKQKSLWIHIGNKNPKLAFKEGIFSDDELVNNFRILLRKIDHNSPYVEGVTIFDNTNPVKQRTIIAEKATIEFKESMGMIDFMLYNGEVHEMETFDLGKYMISKFDSLLQKVPIESPELAREGNVGRGDREKDIKTMRSDILRWQDLIHTRENLITERLSRFLDTDISKIPEFQDYIINLKEKDIVKSDGFGFKIENKINHPYIEKINKNQGIVNAVRGYVMSVKSNVKNQKKYLVEIHKKYTIPFACIIFVLIGVPLGVRSRHGGLAVGGSLGVLFFLVYWAFLIGGENLADNQYVEPWISMWAANIVVGIFGIWMTISMIREEGLVDSMLYRVINKISSLSKNKIGD